MRLFSLIALMMSSSAMLGLCAEERDMITQYGVTWHFD